MNSRIRHVRKTLGLNQKEFAQKLGITQSGVSWIEQDGNSISDQNVLLICREFNVNEDWLRTGSGEMFVQPESFSLDDFARSRGATDFEVEIIKAYFELPEEIRKTVINHFKGYLQKEKAAPAQPPAEQEPPQKTDDDIEQRLEAYRQELLAERDAQTSSASPAIETKNA